MTATERLRELLDERGVEHYDGVESTLWLKDEHGYRASADELTSGRMSVHIWCETPEQAIAATLGAGTLTAKQVMAIAGRHQPDYCSDTHVCFDWQAIADELNATLDDVPRLPHFWTHDGVLHIEATRMPTRIVVCEGGTCEFVPKRELDASEAENAKLRELLRIMAYCNQFRRDCDGCSMNGAAGIITERAGCDELLASLREMGVEVDA